MNNNQIGIAIGALLALAGLMKMEVLKEMARKITSDKEKTTFISYAILVGLFVIPALLGYAIPASEVPDGNSPEKPVIRDTNRSDIRDIADAAKDAVILGNEISDKVIADKQKREQNFQENRPQRWVYQIGERISVRNDADLYALYNQIRNVDHLSLFRIGGNVLIFRNEKHSKEELENLLDDFKSQIGGAADVQIVDLMSFCDARNPSIVDKKRHKFGKRKNKAELPCYVCK